MRTFLLTTAIVASVNTYATEVTNSNTHAEAVNIAGKQRMLSQRIAKAYILSSIDTGHKGIFIEELDAAMSLFLSNYEFLRLNFQNTSDEIKRLLKEEFDAWQSFENILATEATPTKIDDVINYSNILLNKCHELVVALEKEAEKNEIVAYNKKGVSSAAQAINISGRQRMLSQRLALYFSAHKITGSPNNLQEINNLRKLQNDELTFLLFETHYNEEIEEKFKEVTLLFEHLDNYLAQDTDMLRIVDMCNHVTALYDQITSNYTEIFQTEIALNQ